MPLVNATYSKFRFPFDDRMQNLCLYRMNKKENYVTEIQNTSKKLMSSSFKYLVLGQGNNEATVSSRLVPHIDVRGQGSSPFKLGDEQSKTACCQQQGGALNTWKKIFCY